MQNYYGVRTSVFDNGSYEVSPLISRGEKKPDDTDEEGREGLVIKNWYDTESIARLAFLKRTGTMRQLASEGAV